MIRVEVLGGLRVYRDGKELRDLPRKPKRAALLVLLAVERDVSREQACFLLWPDNDERGARHALSQTLSELKRELGRSWVDTRGERLVATTELEVDVMELHAAAKDGQPRDVIDLYKGPVLEGVQLAGGVEFERWVEGKRSEVHREGRAAFRAATADADGAEIRLRLARDWVALDALDDEAQHALIEALALVGRRTDALQQYKEYETLILEELEVEPLDQTRELVERVKNGELSTLVPSDVPAPAVAQSRPPLGRSDSDAEGATVPDLGPELRVVRHLRSGSTGAVYLAREPALRRKVAVKILKAKLAQHGKAIRRFEHEALFAARILHPHVATVFRVGETADDRPFIVMPYIKGVTLADRIKARGPLTSREVARVLSEVASALAAAHSVGVIHRDVRPGNVLYEDDTGRTYLADFGVAGLLDAESEEITRLTEKGEILGHPEYVSPEAQKGRELDDRSDVYSLGVMGRELLLGRPTRDGSELASVNPRDREIADEIRRATAAQPEARPTASDLADAFKRIAAEYDRRTGLLGDLRRRRMPQFVGAYLAAGVAGMGGVDQLVQQDLLEPVAYRLALAFFVAGLNATIILAWFHGERGRQRVSPTEIVLLSSVLVAFLIAVAIVLT